MKPVSPILRCSSTQSVGTDVMGLTSSRFKIWGTLLNGILDFNFWASGQGNLNGQLDECEPVPSYLTL
jgi:hypothetical protein